MTPMSPTEPTTPTKPTPTVPTTSADPTTPAVPTTSTDPTTSPSPPTWRVRRVRAAVCPVGSRCSGVQGIGEVRPGDDIAALLGGADLRDGDILVITSKIVSKAEGRVPPRPLDRLVLALIAEETERVAGQAR